MRKFTTKEIELCKKIAEKEEKELKCGDWIIPHSYGGQPSIVLRVEPDGKHYAFTPDDKKGEHYILGFIDMNFPIWQEHDCLIWLKKKSWRILDVYCGLKKPKDGWNVAIIPWDGKVSDIDGRRDVKEFEAKTFLEALLRAVLAILEEK